MEKVDDEKKGVVLESINWQRTFLFTHIFRTFRLAIHPTKLGFALSAVLLCYFAGQIMDFFSVSRVIVEHPYYSPKIPADEIQKFISAATFADFHSWRNRTIMRNKGILAEALKEYAGYTELQAQEAVRAEKGLEILATTLRTRQRKILDILKREYKTTKESIKQRMSAELKSASEELKETVEREYRSKLSQLKEGYEYLKICILKSSRVASMVISLTPQEAVDVVIPTSDESAKARKEVLGAIELADTYDRLLHLRGLGVFESALSYGILMFNCAVDSVLSAKLFFNENFEGFASTPDVPPGLVRTLGLAFMGLAWFACVHYIYFVIYVLICLAVWSIAGGAICRVSALHATRDEKIPVKEAFVFAKDKFWSFFTAPLLPVVFLGLCCLGLILFGLIGAIPIVGEIITGVIFVLPLAIGFVLAIIIVGAIGGLGLMYPTIAVEGSDSFDAFSRCYSYVYARPWKTIFYTLIAAIYGTLCFVFVKLFIGLVFSATSKIMGLTMNIDSASLSAPLGKLEAMWFSPTLAGPFFGRFYLFPLSTSEAIGSFFIALWVLLLVGLVIAFAISFFFSGYSIIYLLLRRDVDGTELDEVFVEEFEPQVPLAEAREETAEAEKQGNSETSTTEVSESDTKDEKGQEDKEV